MAKKILIIEDNLAELEVSAAELAKGDYNVIKVSSIAKAGDAIKANKPIDCLILDLNISNEFLPDGLKHKAHGGSLTGWVWLFNIAKPDLTNDPKIIIYSEFIDELEEEMETASSEEQEYYKCVVPVTKTKAVNGKEYLLQEVNKLWSQRDKS